MARGKDHGNGRLEEAIQSLIQAQAALVQNQAVFQSQFAEWQRANAERFARIESILMEHSRILRAMPDAVREKIGFKAPEPTKQGE